MIIFVVSDVSGTSMIEFVTPVLIYIAGHAMEVVKAFVE
jgi:glutamate-1-semialdehyde aminotransferase